MRRASAQGYTQFDLLKIARAQGLTQAEIEKLDKRFKSAETVAYVAENASTPLEETRLRKRWQEEMEIFRELKSDIYGYEVFSGNTFLSFQSNLNIPTPPDYILGPGDKLFIDIYGQSENYYQAEVSPDGDLILENFGCSDRSSASYLFNKYKYRVISFSYIVAAYIIKTKEKDIDDQDGFDDWKEELQILAIQGNGKEIPKIDTKFYLLYDKSYKG